MKKVLLILLAVITCFVVTACDKEWTSTVTDYSGEVTSNGGFVVEKGDYIYFINGIASSSDDNNFGTPIKGALLRGKKADIGKAEAKYETVVPKVMFAGLKGNDNGIFIFGDYVYYATPCAEKNKKGEIRTTEQTYFKTKLDGTNTTEIVTISTNSDNYRFVKIDNTVFLAIYTTNADGANVIASYNADTGVKVSESKVATSYKFSTDITSAYAYYVAAIKNEELDQDESFNSVRRFKLDGTEDVEIFNGAGTFSDANNGIAIEGVTFELIKDNGKQLFFKATDINSTTVTTYYGIEFEDVTTSNTASTPATALNFNSAVKLNDGSANASTIFSDTSIYVNLNCIIYLDTAYGFMKYDASKKNNEYFGREQLFYDAAVVGYTFLYVKDGYVYMTDSSNVYYRVKLDEVINLETGAKLTGTPTVTKLTYFTVNASSAWYVPETVGNYLLVSISDEPYYGYVYAVDMLATSGKTDAEITEYATDIATKDEEHLLALHKYRLGNLSDVDKDSYNSYVDVNYHSGTVSSSAK